MGSESPDNFRSRQSDEAGVKVLVDSGAALPVLRSVGQLSNESRARNTSISNSHWCHLQEVQLHRMGRGLDVAFQVADVQRPIVALKDFTSTGYEIEFAPEGAYIQRAARRSVDSSSCKPTPSATPRSRLTMKKLRHMKCPSVIERETIEKLVVMFAL